jgi:uncharacterized membrane protein YGL010W
MRTLNEWLTEYGESHTNETNKLIHWLCVPAIFFSITGLLYSIKLPWFITENFQLNVAVIILLLTTIYYFSLSISIGTGMLLFGILCLALCYAAEAFLCLYGFFVS